MRSDPGGGAPFDPSFKSSFEGLSLEDMNAMVASANWKHLTTTGEALVDAQSKIQSVADDLKSHLSGVSWEGESAQAFQDWGSQLTTQSYDLADYTGLVGEQLITAGSSLQYVQSAMPKSKRTECFVDPKKEQAAVKAEEPDRQEAITLMESLSSSYKWANGQISAGKSPNFQPLPMTFNRQGYLRPYGSVGTSAETGETPQFGRDNVSREATLSEADSSGGPVVRSAARPPAPEAEGRATPRTSLDSIASPSTVTMRPSAAPTHGGPDSSGAGSSRRPDVLLPSYGTAGTLSERTHSITQLPRERPPGEGDAGPDLPSFVHSPTGESGGGIFGGTVRTSPNFRPVRRFSSVIGAEPESPASGVTVGIGSSASSAASGIPSVRGGEMACGQEERGVPAEDSEQFTSGGSGLAGGRAAGGPGMPGLPMSRGGRRGAARPDYLQEEEETWEVGRTDVVPPVLG
ncbi:hypothetical protein [Streptomyces sp. ICBB 8177]|uniref:WXG100 family type VII secretion target n=1 Tax=Streptomyces sp. ICBB 8177 TaxID=563922 RepID=UPI000D676606|nr:hypothetical protein [Streptomyces sp. ICBB 8177]PWI43619.1 hypothetical protein CK485_15990 [Streptomyces sp. ICBB 8177]